MNIQKNGREALQFADALAYLQRGGQKLSRAGWNGDNMFIFWVNGSSFKVNRAPLLGIFEEGTPINYLPHIDMHLPTGDITVWNPTIADICASDWFIVMDEELVDEDAGTGDEVTGDA